MPLPPMGGTPLLEFQPAGRKKEFGSENGADCPPLQPQKPEKNDTIFGPFLNIFFKKFRSSPAFAGRKTSFPGNFFELGGDLHPMGGPKPGRGLLSGEKSHNDARRPPSITGMELQTLMERASTQVNNIDSLDDPQGDFPTLFETHTRTTPPPPEGPPTHPLT